ncbi:STF2 [Candida oxycetoniae]|uniref:STF2 n=1 Tax=Candida oxycetoniae TaxID=497107 RepID=A0AAI9WX10_9ASCO|nr:STF2 [Candida oxycetoniae]KAI3403757.1 STF2 [Candida oxycetoniae]
MSKTKKWTVQEGKPQEPKWFTHNGYSNTNPTKVKKNGAGKNNWGQPGDELNKEDYHMFKSGEGRRNSNHDMNEDKLNELNDLLDKKFIK